MTLLFQTPRTTIASALKLCLALRVSGGIRKEAANLLSTREGIEKLKEYRTALISAAVNGTIDVREIGANSRVE